MLIRILVGVLPILWVASSVSSHGLLRSLALSCPYPTQTKLKVGEQTIMVCYETQFEVTTIYATHTIHLFCYFRDPSIRIRKTI